MEAKELMHGDLFKYFGQLCRFVIYGRGAVVVRMSDDSEYLPIACNDAEPIPLTEKILEANGFEIGAYSTLKLDDNFWLEYYHHENRLRKLWKGIDEWENHTETLDVCFQCECYYVHQLQHALRLCGLDKLADNFKIG